MTVKRHPVKALLISILVLLVAVTGISFIVASTGGGGGGDAVLTGITAEPENLTPIYVDRTKQYKAIAKFSDGTTSDITNSVEWQSSDETKATINSSGLATGVAVGESQITAVDTASSEQSAAVTLKVSAATLDSITVTQKNTGSIPVGATKELIATGNFSDNHTEDLTNKVTWSSDDDTRATVSNDAGKKGFVTGVAAGTPTITATDPSSTAGSLQVTVTAATITDLTIAPDSPPVLPEKHKFTQQFTVLATLSAGDPVDVTESVTWTSSNTTVATVSNEQGTKGLATALTAGTATITATIDSVSDNVTLTVNDATLDGLSARPSNPEDLPVGVYAPFTAVGVFSDSVEREMTNLETVAWQVSATRNPILNLDTDKATISNEAPDKGWVLGLDEGTVFVSWQSSVTRGYSNVVELDITAQTLVAVAIFNEGSGITDLDCDSLVGGQVDTFNLKAIGFYTGFTNTEQDLTRSVTWSSTDPDTVTVANQPEDKKGFTACGAVGTATITVVVPETSGPVIQADVDVTVSQRP